MQHSRIFKPVSFSYSNTSTNSSHKDQCESATTTNQLTISQENISNEAQTCDSVNTEDIINEESHELHSEEVVQHTTQMEISSPQLSSHPVTRLQNNITKPK